MTWISDKNRKFFLHNLWHFNFVVLNLFDLLACALRTKKRKSLEIIYFIKKRHKSSINLRFPLFNSLVVSVYQLLFSKRIDYLFVCLFVGVGFAWIVCQKQADYFHLFRFTLSTNWLFFQFVLSKLFTIYQVIRVLEKHQGFFSERDK